MRDAFATSTLSFERARFSGLRASSVLAGVKSSRGYADSIRERVGRFCLPASRSISEVTAKASIEEWSTSLRTARATGSFSTFP